MSAFGWPEWVITVWVAGRFLHLTAREFIHYGEGKQGAVAMTAGLTIIAALTALFVWALWAGGFWL